MTRLFFRGYFGLPTDPPPALNSADIRFLEQQGNEDQAAAQARYRANAASTTLLLPNQLELGYLRVTGLPSDVFTGDNLTLSYQTNLNDAGNTVEWYRLNADRQVVSLGTNATLSVVATEETRRYFVRRKTASGVILLESEVVSVTANPAASILRGDYTQVQRTWLTRLAYTYDEDTHECTLHAATTGGAILVQCALDADGRMVPGAAWPRQFHAPDTQYPRADLGYNLALRFNPAVLRQGGILPNVRYQVQFYRAAAPGDAYGFSFHLPSGSVRSPFEFDLPVYQDSPTTNPGSDNPGSGGESTATPNYQPGTADGNSGFGADSEGQAVNEEKAPALT